MSYGSNQEAQIIAYGATNADLDLISESARKLATAKINAYLDISENIESPSQQVETCANTLAAAIISTSPEATAKSALWLTGIEILEGLSGDDMEDSSFRINIPVDRFTSRGLSNTTGLNIVGNQS